MSRVLEDGLRRSDGAYRIGGDEVALILVHGPQGGHVSEVTRRIETALAQPAAGEPVIGISFGAVASRGDDDPERLLRRADEAMYEAKRSK